MSTLHLLCGLPASGKTTHARRLEAAGAVRITLDEWLLTLYGLDELAGRDAADHRARFRARMERVYALVEPLAEGLLRRGQDVVFDFGLWERADRERFRALAGRAGSRARTTYFAAPIELLAARLEARGRDLPPGCFPITPAALRAFAPRFEAPGPDEEVEVVGPGA